jgi:D-3-phosphoglycerate dehydrogenase / 2-oxoglutarate reductase
MATVIIWKSRLDNDLKEKLATKEIQAEIVDSLSEVQNKDKVEVIITSVKETLFSEDVAPFPGLKAVWIAGGGVDNIDYEITSSGKIEVSSVDSNTNSTAEFTVMLILMSLRNINSKEGQGVWSSFDHGGSDLFFKNVGILGLGRIGRIVARALKSLGANVVAYDNDKENSAFEKFDIPCKSFEEVMKFSDILSIHLPRNYQTRDLIGKKELMMMPSDSILVNTARGDIVVEKDLIEVLNSGHLKGCALDVFDKEPLQSDSPLKTMENCIITNHMAGYTENSRKRLLGALLRKTQDILHKK